MLVQGRRPRLQSNATAVMKELRPSPQATTQRSPNPNTATRSSSPPAAT